MTPRAEREFDDKAAGVLWVLAVVVLALIALAMSAVASWS